jgi:hypothetical protein
MLLFVLMLGGGLMEFAPTTLANRRHRELKIDKVV